MLWFHQILRPNESLKPFPLFPPVNPISCYKWLIRTTDFPSAIGRLLAVTGPWSPSFHKKAGSWAYDHFRPAWWCRNPKCMIPLLVGMMLQQPAVGMVFLKGDWYVVGDIRRTDHFVDSGNGYRLYDGFVHPRSLRSRGCLAGDQSQSGSYDQPEAETCIAQSRPQTRSKKKGLETNYFIKEQSDREIAKEEYHEIRHTGPSRRHVSQDQR